VAWCVCACGSRKRRWWWTPSTGSGPTRSSAPSDAPRRRALSESRAARRAGRGHVGPGHGGDSECTGHVTGSSKVSAGAGAGFALSESTVASCCPSQLPHRAVRVNCRIVLSESTVASCCPSQLPRGLLRAVRVNCRADSERALLIARVPARAGFRPSRRASFRNSISCRRASRREWKHPKWTPLRSWCWNLRHHPGRACSGGPCGCQRRVRRRARLGREPSFPRAILP
jgi:hypothetical protein